MNAPPTSPITALDSTCANSTGNSASVPDAGGGASYSWSISGGTITAGSGTRTITFTAGANGWTGTTSGFNSEWTMEPGQARLTFYDSGGFPNPDVGSFSNTVTASGGAFTGDYAQASIALLGFRLRAEDVPLTNFSLRWGGSTSVFQRFFTIGQTGVWKTFAASLASPELGGWSVLQGSTADFHQACADVRFVALRLQSGSGFEHSFLLDEFFLARLPAATAIQSAGASNLITWSYLRSNETYRMESADTATGPWSPGSTITATGTTHLATEPASNTLRLYRITLR